MAASRSRRANAGSRMTEVMERDERDPFYASLYGGFYDENDDTDFKANITRKKKIKPSTDTDPGTSAEVKDEEDNSEDDVGSDSAGSDDDSAPDESADEAGPDKEAETQDTAEENGGGKSEEEGTKNDDQKVENGEGTTENGELHTENGHANDSSSDKDIVTNGKRSAGEVVTKSEESSCTSPAKKPKLES